MNTFDRASAASKIEITPAVFEFAPTARLWKYAFES